MLADVHFRTLLFADATGKPGTCVGLVALPVLARTTLDAGAAEVGLLTALTTLPLLLTGLPVDARGDRRRKRGILVAADLSRAVLVASVPVAWLSAAGTRWTMIPASVKRPGREQAARPR
ncbi:hypothetical protein [Actinomadura keratinilytica]|uniref:MFS transporter n=1 Tax=Actinomadura keratinilytica TaxID=547461 RepID=A0ABP7ZHB3_9ACTN